MAILAAALITRGQAGSTYLVLHPFVTEHTYGKAGFLLLACTVIDRVGCGLTS